MSSGFVARAHWALDAIAGAATGFYRVAWRPGDAATNANAHYVLGHDVAAARVNAALHGPLPIGIYPVALWAGRFLDGIDAPHICDFGGGYGEACIQLGRLLPARFTVAEVPEVVHVARGVELTNGIAFTETLPDSCDLLISNGVIQNAHDAVFDGIARIQPRAVIITGVEITRGETFRSMQVNRRHGRRCPYITFNEVEFVSRVAAMGYDLRDSWSMGKAGSGPFLDGRVQPEYRGFAFLRHPSHR